MKQTYGIALEPWVLHIQRAINSINGGFMPKKKKPTGFTPEQLKRKQTVVGISFLSVLRTRT